MKAILQFNLPDDDREYKIATQSSDLLRFVWDFNQMLRNYQKYGHSFKDADDALSKIRQNFYDLLNQYPNVNIDL